MEVSVTKGAGLPSKPYISIRMGETRRQAPFKAGDVFKFPTHKSDGTPCKTCLVDIFEKVGSARISLADLDIAPGGEDADGFWGRGKSSVDEQVTVTRADGSDVLLGLKLKLQGDTAPRPCVQSDPAKSSGKKLTLSSESSASAKEYLESHGMQGVLEMMVHGLLESRPSDPLAFIADFVKAHRPQNTQPVRAAQARNAETEKVRDQGLAVQQASAETDTIQDLRLQARQVLAQSAESGSLQDALQKRREEKVSSRVQPGYTREDTQPQTIQENEGAVEQGAAVDPGEADEELWTMWVDEPGLGNEEYPGFPADECPETLPDLSGHFSLLAEVLKQDPSLYDKLKGLRTKSGVTLAKVMKTGMDNKGHKMMKTVGMTACDEECYTLFGELFDRVLTLRYGQLPLPGKDGGAFEFPMLDHDHIEVGVTDGDDEAILEAMRDYTVCTQLRCSRNIRGFRLLPACSRNERREVERVAAQALFSIAEEIGEFRGDYYPLRGSESYSQKPGGMTLEEEESLEESAVLFHEPDSAIMLSAGIGRHWPDARGVFTSPENDFLVWVNEEDHLRFLMSRPGADLTGVLALYSKAHGALSRALQQAGTDFMYCNERGFLTACPSHVGAGLRVSMTMFLPLLSARRDFNDICATLQLVASRAGHEAGMWDILSPERLGASAKELVDLVFRGCRQLAKIEHDLTHQMPISLPGRAAEPHPT